MCIGTYWGWQIFPIDISATNITAIFVAIFVPRNPRAFALLSLFFYPDEFTSLKFILRSGSFDLQRNFENQGSMIISISFHYYLNFLHSFPVKSFFLFFCDSASFATLINTLGSIARVFKSKQILECSLNRMYNSGDSQFHS